MTTRQEREVRREENANAATLMADLIHKGRRVGAERAKRLVVAALRRYPMARYPHRKERIERAFEWVFAQTKPRRGKAMAADQVGVLP